MTKYYPLRGQTRALIGAEGVVTSMVRSCWRENPEEHYHSVGFDIRFPYFTVAILGPPLENELIAYCLESNRTAPPAGTLLEGIDPYAGLAGLSEEQVTQILWLLENGYPANSANTLFYAAGVDPALAPPLLDFDAFTATQIAIWIIETKLPYYQVEDCENAFPHPKSPRIGATAQYLVNRALAVGGTRQPPAITLTAISETATEIDGVYYVGPYQINTNAEGTVQLQAPLGSNAYIVNEDYQPQTGFYPENIFYVAIPGVEEGQVCVNVQASFIGAEAAAAVMFPKNQSGMPLPTMQHLGMALYIPDTLLAQDEITACANIPPNPPLPPPEPLNPCCWILVPMPCCAPIPCCNPPCQHCGYQASIPCVQPPVLPCNHCCPHAFHCTPSGINPNFGRRKFKK